MNVLRQQIDTHRCPVPVRDVEITLPSAALDPAVRPKPFIMQDIIDGSVGDLWRCDECGRLWRCTWACDYCDLYGSQPHYGVHTPGRQWRHATLWQRIRYRKAGYA